MSFSLGCGECWSEYSKNISSILRHKEKKLIRANPTRSLATILTRLCSRITNANRLLTTGLSWLSSSIPKQRSFSRTHLSKALRRLLEKCRERNKPGGSSPLLNERRANTTRQERETGWVADYCVLRALAHHQRCSTLMTSARRRTTTSANKRSIPNLVPESRNL